MDSLNVIYYGLLAVCLLTLLLNIRGMNRVYYLFIPLIILGITVQVFGDVLKNHDVQGYSFVFHLYQPAEYSLLALFYYSLIKNSLVKKAILVSVAAVVIFSAFYYSLNPDSFYGGDFTDFCIAAFFICIWVVVFFIELLRSDENLNLTAYPAFWINAGNLLFYGGCLLIMGVYFYLHNRNANLASQLLKLNYYLNLILYCMYTIAFLCPMRKKS
ncbi:MAG: hypothetical protein IPP72_01055 [Chitinophagaceae bacterium]|nr:hypothetical protein [Chitinophagaceae bacterium]